MSIQDIFTRLEALGSEKVFARNKKQGAGDNQFGVKLGDIRKLGKNIKTNHELALELWETKNLEARLLAILVIKPENLGVQELDNMVKSIEVSQLADWFNAYVIKEHPDHESLRTKWMDSDNIWAARSGWSLTAGKVVTDPLDLDIDQLLNRIEKEMPTASPEVQWTMNTALVQIGFYFPEHRKKAIDIGEELGVYRDFPVSKGCTSPFAPLWIKEMVNRQEK